MSIKAIYSFKDVAVVAQDLKKQTASMNPTLIIYFASAKYNPAVLSSSMQEVFKGCALMGCSTAGEITSGMMLKQSVSAMAFDSSTIEDVCIAVLENVQDENGVQQAFKKFENHYKTPLQSLDFKKYVGVVLIDGLSCTEERLMEKIGDFTDIIFVGGSAGDDLQFKKTHVFNHGKAYTNAAVLALIKTRKGFDILKTQSFKPLDKKLVATSVIEAKRRVNTFNDKPAVQAYAEAVGVPVAAISSRFMDHPVGLMIGEEPYVRSPQQVQDTAMLFYCNIKQGMELRLLESTDIVTDTKCALEHKQNALGSIEGILNFHCILRTLELEQKKQCEAYGALFSSIPTAGFSTYGEEYMGHINQTSTMLLFKK